MTLDEASKVEAAIKALPWKQKDEFAIDSFWYAIGFFWDSADKDSAGWWEHLRERLNKMTKEN